MEQLLKAAVSKSNELQPTVSPAVLLKGKKTKSRGTDYVILTSCCGPHLDGPQTPGLWSTFGPLARCLETWFKGTVTFFVARSNYWKTQLNSAFGHWLVTATWKCFVSIMTLSSDLSPRRSNGFKLRREDSNSGRGYKWPLWFTGITFTCQWLNS